MPSYITTHPSSFYSEWLSLSASDTVSPSTTLIDGYISNTGFYTGATFCSILSKYEVQISWTGSPVGYVYIQACNDSLLANSSTPYLGLVNFYTLQFIDLSGDIYTSLNFTEGSPIVFRDLNPTYNFMQVVVVNSESATFNIRLTHQNSSAVPGVV